MPVFIGLLWLDSIVASARFCYCLSAMQRNALADAPQAFSDIPTSYIYIISAGRGQLKVGIAQDIQKRMAQLQTGCPEHLRLVHQVPIVAIKAQRLEKALHRRLKRYRIRGEWFRLSAAFAIKAVESAASSFARDHTLAQADDDGMVIAWLHCRDCGHIGSARVPAAHRLRFKCSGCGSRNTSWRLYGR